MPLETELKLSIAPADVGRLLRHKLVKAGADRARRRLYSVYYDTPNLDLWRAGATLRLRRDGRRWVQTVKSGGGVSAGLHERHEFESPVASPAPDFAALEASDVAAHFSSHELRARLKPSIVTDFTRTSCLVSPAAGVVIELAVDRGSIRCGKHHAPISEIELEMKAGPAWRAHQIALELIADVPLFVEDRSKAQRGIALLTGEEERPVKPGHSQVAPGMLATDVFKALILACLSHYTANQRGMLETDDPEYLHQMRVALRRLRSVFSTFAPLFPPAAVAAPVAEARWLSRILGDARDWDVFATQTLPPLRERYAEDAGLARLARATARQRSLANRRARTAVASARGQGLVIGLSAWVTAETWQEALDDAQLLAMHRPADEFARATLDRCLKRVLTRGRKFARLAPAELHRLRISAKKLRYATEFFSPLFEAQAAAGFRSALMRLQDELGAYNDAVKTAEFAARASRGLRGAPVDKAVGILLGWGAGTQDSGARHLKRVWKSFRGEAPFWK